MYPDLTCVLAVVFNVVGSAILWYAFGPAVGLGVFFLVLALMMTIWSVLIAFASPDPRYPWSTSKTYGWWFIKNRHTNDL